MNRDNASLLDIAKAARKILQFSEGLDRPSLKDNEEKQSAILYQAIIIGEAVKRLSTRFRESHPEIPWKADRGTRKLKSLHHELFKAFDRKSFPHQISLIDNNY